MRALIIGIAGAGLGTVLLGLWEGGWLLGSGGLIGEDASYGWILVLGTMLGSLTTAVVTQIIRIFKARHDARRETRKDALDEWRELNSRLEEQIDRYGAVIEQQQAALEAMWRAESICRTALAERTVCIKFLWDHLVLLHNKLKEIGHDLGDLPQMPTMSEIPPPTNSEFLLRQAKQSASLVRKVGENLKATGKPEDGNS